MASLGRCLQEPWSVEEPIVLLAFPRTGSTMVSHIFRDHGVWLGECEPKMSNLPTGGGENIQIKTILRSMFSGGLGEMKQHIPGFREKVERVLSKQGYEEGPWAMKHALAYWRAWDEFDPYYILIERDKDQLLASNNNSGVAGVSGKQLLDMYEKNEQEMKHIKTFAPTIKTSEIIKGDYSSIEDAFRYCGLDFDPNIANSVINPELWHYGS